MPQLWIQGGYQMMEIRYETKYNIVCITPCTLLDNLEGNRPMVGSARCQLCSNFCRKDSKRKIVSCRRNPTATFSGLKKKYNKPLRMKQMKQVLCIETGVVYNSIREAATAHGLSTTSITNSCKSGKTTRKKATFKFM